MRANLEVLVTDRAETDAPQAHDGVADRIAHVAHLPRASLVQRDRDQRLILPGPETGVEQSHDRWRGPPSPDGHSAPEPLQRILSRHAPHARVILPFHLMLRVQQALHEFPVVRQQQQAFGIVVEAPNRIDVLPYIRQQVEHRRPPLGILPGRHVAARLVEQDVAMPLREVNPLPVHADVVAGGVGLRAQLEDGRAVDRNASVRDERFSGAPRRDAGGGEDLLESLDGLFHVATSCSAWRVPARRPTAGGGSRRNPRAAGLPAGRASS